MIIVLIIFAFSSLYYLCATLFLYSGLRRISTHAISKKANDLSFSIVIAAHNEEANIEACLQSVLSQTIDVSRFEVIVVNDRSEDATEAIVRRLMQSRQNLSVVTITETPRGFSPKKHAVSQGIARCSNEIIVFTDADCRVAPAWLETIAGYFDARTGLVQGMTSYAYPAGMNTFFFGVQALDFLSHGVVSASAIGRGFPLNSNANNFAFRKAAFDSAGGYGIAGGVVSGDDDLLLQRIWKSGRWEIRYMADSRGAVQTFPALTARALFEQRKRWGSKTVHYNFVQTLFLSGIFMFYCCLAGCILAAGFFPPLWLAAGVMMMVKLLGEAVLLIPGTALFNKKELRHFIAPASFLHLPLVLVAVILGVFGRFGWKDQTFKRTMKPR